jgi:hypothetical protein
MNLGLTQPLTEILLLSKRYNSCSLGFLNNFLPFEVVLGPFRSFKKLHLSQVIPDVIPSVLTSSHWSSYKWLAFIHFPYNTGFRLFMFVSKPTLSLGFNIIYHFFMFVPCIAGLCIENQHCAVGFVNLFTTNAAPTCFGTYVPSSGSVFVLVSK